MPSLLGEDPRVIPNKRNTTIPTGQGLLDAAALLTSPVPIGGDIMGLLADANNIRQEGPSFGNVGMAALGLLPFVPGGSALRSADVAVKPPIARVRELKAEHRSINEQIANSSGVDELSKRKPPSIDDAARMANLPDSAFADDVFDSQMNRLREINKEIESIITLNPEIVDWLR